MFSISQDILLKDKYTGEIHDLKKDSYEFDIETEGCGTYHARYFESLTIKESPLWLKSALLANDMKPINNVVDISATTDTISLINIFIWGFFTNIRT